MDLLNRNIFIFLWEKSSSYFLYSRIYVPILIFSLQSPCVNLNHGIYVDDMVSTFVVDISNMIPCEPVYEWDESFSKDGMHTSNGNEMDSKHVVVSVVVESTFVRDKKYHPILTDEVLFPIQNVLWHEVIRILSESPPLVVPKKSKRGAHRVYSTIVNDVPCVVWCDKNLPWKWYIWEHCSQGTLISSFWYPTKSISHIWC